MVVVGGVGWGGGGVTTAIKWMLNVAAYTKHSVINLSLRSVNTLRKIY